MRKQWKKRKLGCVDQLLINKMIYKQVKERRKNLTVWLDYKKGFDSLPHAWIIKSLQLAKIPDMIIEAIRMLMTKWRTKQARSHNEANEAVASPKISKKNLPQMKNS